MNYAQLENYVFLENHLTCVSFIGKHNGLVHLLYAVFVYYLPCKYMKRCLVWLNFGYREWLSVGKYMKRGFATVKLWIMNIVCLLRVFARNCISS